MKILVELETEHTSEEIDACFEARVADFICYIILSESIFCPDRRGDIFAHFLNGKDKSCARPHSEDIET